MVDIIQPLDIQVVDVDDSNYDSLVGYVEIILLARTSIDEFHLPTPNQEISFSKLDKDKSVGIPKPDNIEVITLLSNFPHINQDIILEFEYTSNNYIYKEIRSH